MADRFRDFSGLVDAVADSSVDRPPAIVANAHITGLGVARALSAHDVPVIAVDRTGDGVAPYSRAVDLAGRVTYPLDDADGFAADVEALADHLGQKPVAFGCMDEWVHGLADTQPAGVHLPFAAERIERVLDKESLYGIAADLGIPHPETYRVDGVGSDASHLDRRPDPITTAEVADLFGFPLVVKPALKREFEEAIGTNVVEVGDRAALEDVVERARRHDIRIMVQERVPMTPSADRSYVSYVPPDGEPMGISGNPTRYPQPFGTSCLVSRVETPAVESRARAVLAETDYHGISEAEFVHDADRDEYLLLDVNTRPWKWIGLPVECGMNLPYAAYADAVGATAETGPIRDGTWVYLRDYLALLSEGGKDSLSRADWLALVSGGFEDRPGLTTGVYAPSDPGPTAQLLATEFGEREYYCSC